MPNRRDKNNRRNYRGAGICLKPIMARPKFSIMKGLVKSIKLRKRSKK